LSAIGAAILAVVGVTLRGMPTAAMIATMVVIVIVAPTAAAAADNHCAANAVAITVAGGITRCVAGRVARSISRIGIARGYIPRRHIPWCGVPRCIGTAVIGAVIIAWLARVRCHVTAAKHGGQQYQKC